MGIKSSKYKVDTSTENRYLATITLMRDPSYKLYVKMRNYAELADVLKMTMELADASEHPSLYKTQIDQLQLRLRANRKTLKTIGKILAECETPLYYPI